jgi:hypothetical protein
MSLLDKPLTRTYSSWFKRLSNPPESNGTKAKYNQYGVYQMSFKDLKKQSSLGSLTAKLTKEAEKMNNKGGGADDRLPWVKLFSHAFQGPGGWYIENSLTTIGGKDPIGELNRELWNSGNDADKDTVRKQKRKLSFYANIYVVKDPANPQNEGGVFLYKFGKKIFDKVMDVMQPEFEDETPINPFDFWQGANFKLKLQKKDGYWNYDKSEFDRPSPLLDDDDALEGIWKKQYSLAAFTAADQFKSYDDLKKRLDYVLGNKSTLTSTQQEETEYDNYAATEQRKVSEEQVMQKLEDSYKASKTTADFNSPDIGGSKADDDEDPMSYFAKLADS